MTLDEAMKWAGVFGPPECGPPDGDAIALSVLAAEVRRLTAEKAMTLAVFRQLPKGTGQPRSELFNREEKHMQINWIKPRHGSSCVPPGASLRTGLSARDKHGNVHSFVTLYSSLMSELRLVAGDRVMVGEADGYIAVKRVPFGGYALCATGAAKERREKKLGTPCTATVKFTGNAVKSPRVYRREDLTIMNDGTILVPIAGSSTPPGENA